MKAFNVLVLSCGRRVELINCFKSAMKRLGCSGKVVGADMSTMAPALFYADERRQLPHVLTEGYIPALIDLCKKDNISVVVPTIDTELPILAANKARIESETDARVLISSANVIGICKDKILTHGFLTANGFGAAKHYKASDVIPESDFPLFIKPVDGSSSVDAHKVENTRQLQHYLGLIKKPMIEEFLVGNEYSIDAFLDFDGKLITLVPRLRIATRSGEILKGTVVKDDEIENDVERLLLCLKPIGQVTIQCVKTPDGIKYIEINPRFGGGSPMSIKAGADSCENLLRLLNGESLSRNRSYKENLTFLRFDACCTIDENGELIDDKSDCL